MKNHDDWLSGTIVEFAEQLAYDDLTELTRTLAERCMELFEATDVSVVLVDEHDTWHSIACTSEGLCELPRLKLLRNEAPWFDCILTGAPVEARLNDDAALARWPAFDPVATEAGYQQVISLPMRLRDTVIGAVNAFIASPREVPAADLHLAGALASITTLAILNQRALRRSAVVAAQLQGALDSRISIEQAKGMLAQRHGISVDEAFHLLRGHARSHNRRLTDVARSIANRQFALDSSVVEP